MILLLAALEPGQRIVTDQSFRSLDAGHHFIAGVDALGAADAFHLGAVPDVDPGRADADAEAAVDAVAEAGAAFLDHLQLLAARLAAGLVVADDQGLLVEKD